MRGEKWQCDQQPHRDLRLLRWLGDRSGQAREYECGVRSEQHWCLLCISELRDCVTDSLSTRVLHLDTLITEHQIDSEEKRVESEREMSQVTLLEPLVKLFFRKS